MLGTVINERFQVEQRLARQGATEIYEGLDLVAGHPIWVKRFEAPLDQDLDFIENWRAQLLNLQAIEDGHLPQIYDFGRLPTGDLYQIEEPPHGITLRRFSATRAPMGVAAIVSLLAAVARAVGTGHREGTAHGGLSPDNVYIEEEAGNRLESFVSSWEAGEMIVALRSAGEALPERVARYLAPEQRSLPVPPATPATDVYALGTILYELLTGSLPSAMASSQGEPPPPRRFNPDIPVAVEREVLRALSHDPAARHPNGYALSQALTHALTVPEPQVVAPPPPIVQERIERVTVSRPLWLPAVALLATLLICTLLFLLVLSNRNRNQAVAVIPTPSPRVVPKLAGPPYLGYNDAVTRAWNEGFIVTIVGFVEGPNIPPGVVVTQCPQAGALPSEIAQCPSVGFPAGENTILVEVSSLPAPVVLRVIPDLYGQPEPEARALLQQGDLRIGTRREAYDLLIPQGRIVEQNPRRGLAVLPGTSVDVIVSAGAPPAGQPGAVIEPPAAEVIPPVVESIPPTEAIIVEPLATDTPLLIEPPTPQPTLTTPPAPVVTPSLGDEGLTVLLADDFEEGNTLGWIVSQGEGQNATIRDGVFVAEVTESGLFWKSQPGRLFTDFTYEAEVTLGRGQPGPGGRRGHHLPRAGRRALLLFRDQRGGRTPPARAQRERLDYPARLVGDPLDPASGAAQHPHHDSRGGAVDPPRQWRAGWR